MSGVSCMMPGSSSLVRPSGLVIVDAVSIYSCRNVSLLTRVGPEDREDFGREGRGGKFTKARGTAAMGGGEDAGLELSPSYGRPLKRLGPVFLGRYCA